MAKIKFDSPLNQSEETRREARALWRKEKERERKGGVKTRQGVLAFVCFEEIVKLSRKN